MQDKESKQLRKVVLASQGKCRLVLPYPRCHRGKFPFCTDGKTANVKKPFLRCRD